VIFSYRQEVAETVMKSAFPLYSFPYALITPEFSLFSVAALCSCRGLRAAE
jgi:hypothetical protein